MNVAELELDGSDGVESSDVSGVAVSTIQMCSAGVASMLPPASIALTWNV